MASRSSTRHGRDVSPDIQKLRHNMRLDRIHYMPIDALTSYQRKLRKRSDVSLRALAASIAGFGIVLPILIDEHSVIIAGEGIVEAARSLGYTEVPTLRIEHFDDTEVRLLRLALNKLGEQSEWDKVELAAEFTELLSIEVEIAYEVSGFATPEIDNLIHAPMAGGETDPGDDPDDALVGVGEPGSAVSRLDDIWELGAHRVLCGSSLEEENLAKLMGDDHAVMVLTDQPYNLKIGGNVSGLGKRTHREFAEASGEKSEAEFTAFLTTSISAMAGCCEDGALLYMFMDWRHMWEMLSGIRVAGLKLFQLPVWIKKSPAMGGYYRSQHELCFVAKKGQTPHRNNIQLGRFGRSRSNCWHYAGVNSFGPGRDEQLAMHPTCKNVSMLADAIRDATHRGEIILDGFLGSGSTLIAAERTSRICRGVELYPLYVDVIIHRWERATGRKATLVATDETFAEVAARRMREAQRPKIVARPRTRPPVSA